MHTLFTLAWRMNGVCTTFSTTRKNKNMASNVLDLFFFLSFWVPASSDSLHRDPRHIYHIMQSVLSPRQIIKLSSIKRQAPSKMVLIPCCCVCCHFFVSRSTDCQRAIDIDVRTGAPHTHVLLFYNFLDSLINLPSLIKHLSRESSQRLIGVTAEFSAAGRSSLLSPTPRHSIKLALLQTPTTQIDSGQTTYKNTATLGELHYCYGISLQ